MAQTGTTAPKRGQDWGLMILGVMVAVFLGMLAVGYMAFKAVPESAMAEAPTTVAAPQATQVPATQATYQAPQDVDNEPAVSAGVGGEWEAWDEARANKKEMGYALTDSRLHPDFTTKELSWLIWYERQGYDFTVWVPKGTLVVNTGYRNGNYYVTNAYPLKTGRWALYRLNGDIAVLESCGNAAKVVKFGPSEKPTCPKPKRPVRPDRPKRPREPKPLRNDDPGGKYTPHHPGNDTYYYPTDPGRTPGANSPEEIEEVAKDQEKQVPGNRDSTPHGTDSGSTDNPTNSETTNPDGTTEQAPRGNEVEETPPSNETVNGTIDPDAIP